MEETTNIWQKFEEDFQEHLNHLERLEYIFILYKDSEDKEELEGLDRMRKDFPIMYKEFEDTLSEYRKKIEEIEGMKQGIENLIQDCQTTKEEIDAIFREEKEGA